MGDSEISKTLAIYLLGAQNYVLKRRKVLRKVLRSADCSQHCTGFGDGVAGDVVITRIRPGASARASQEPYLGWDLKDRSTFDRQEGKFDRQEGKFLYKQRFVVVVQWLSCDPMDCSLPASSLHRIFQARILEWVSTSSFRRSFQPRGRTWVSCVPCIVRQIVYH